MLVFAIVAVFIAGLMVGRTPEYLGKKIEAYEMKMASIVMLIPPMLVLVGTAHGRAVRRGQRRRSPTPARTASREILYAFSSAGNNNGSAFAGLSANTPFYNTALGIAMWFGRFWLIIRCWPSPARWPPRRRVAAGAGHVADAHAAVRRACWSAWC